MSENEQPALPTYDELLDEIDRLEARCATLEDILCQIKFQVAETINCTNC